VLALHFVTLSLLASNKRRSVCDGTLIVQVMILSQDKERGRISLSTKKLEPTPGDMLRNPALVYEKVGFCIRKPHTVRHHNFMC